MSKDEVEIHGCIVCARTFNILAVYTLDGRLVDCIVTGPGGHCAPATMDMEATNSSLSYPMPRRL